LVHLETELGDERLRSAEGALLRGGHWRNFLVKYSEANRMHKKMQRLSLLCRERGDPPEARRAIGRAQCNDAYWHGVFGGLYLPHLRAAVWRNLGHAESTLRHGESLTCETLDADGDGLDELWIHSAACSVVISPHRGGAIEELSVFAHEVNFADVLTRRREVYHRLARPVPPAASDHDENPGIHDVEEGLSAHELPPLDHHVRSLLDERVLGHDLPLEDYRRAAFVPIVAWGGMVMDVTDIAGDAESLAIRLALRDGDRLHAKEIIVDAAGNLTVRYRWDPNAFPTGAWFAPELSLARDVELHCRPEADAWRYPITTVAKSERGLEETVQGISITPRWPVSVGEAELRLRTGVSLR
jgi:alpha-amylase